MSSIKNSLLRALRASAVNSLVFPELLEKTALVDFLKQGKINETLRRRFPCLRLLFGHAI